MGLLAQVAGKVGDPQVRHRGTIGGSIAHGDPASDLPAAVLALGGELVVEGPAGRRVIPAGDFFLGFLETALRPRDRGADRGRECRRRRTGARLPEVRAAGPGLGDGRGGGGPRINGSVGVSLVNMGQTPLRASGVEEALAAGASVIEAAQLADRDTEPSGDANASPEFRRHLSRVLTARALARRPA